MNKQKKICFIGAGNMGEALIKGLGRDKSAFQIGIFDTNKERTAVIKKNYKVAILKTVLEINEYEICILAIKPQTVHEVIGELSSFLKKNVLLVSIAAGLTIGFYKKYFPQNRIARVMPNTPALINQGMSGICFSADCSLQHKKIVSKIFENVGDILPIEEKLMNSVTALSGSGPAYFFYFADVFAREALEIGLNYNDALHLISKTMLGAAQMILRNKQTPAELVSMVTSPKGTTEAALKVLQASEISAIIKDTLLGAKKRAEELSKNI
ncbi:MAG: pyrroline-5-carboxylate reductase [Candidatus Margulisbacteria bacterium]|nr:pyrroline-5-carboxylate reductase [Candidatus Margulisiibacteriota bacterium]